jgi:hypothetical protein
VAIQQPTGRLRGLVRFVCSDDPGNVDDPPASTPSRKPKRDARELDGGRFHRRRVRIKPTHSSRPTRPRIGDERVRRDARGETRIRDRAGSQLLLHGPFGRGAGALSTACPIPRSKMSSPEVGSCAVGSNQDRQAHPVAVRSDTRAQHAQGRSPRPYDERTSAAASATARAWASTGKRTPASSLCEPAPLSRLRRPLSADWRSQRPSRTCCARSPTPRYLPLFCAA